LGSELILKYFPDLSERQKEQIDALFPLYHQWNERINVISRKDIELLYERHVLHSLSIAKFISFKPGTSILDLGTGGGFPGVPLAIFFPESSFHLVDSIEKKITVVKEVAKSLGLANLTATHDRVERVKEKYDFIVSRAVAKTKQLFIWTHQKIKESSKNDIDNGWILLKGGDLSEELKELRRPYIETPLTNYFEEAFFETKKLVFIPR